MTNSFQGNFQHLKELDAEFCRSLLAENLALNFSAAGSFFSLYMKCVGSFQPCLQDRGCRPMDHNMWQVRAKGKVDFSILYWTKIYFQLDKVGSHFSLCHPYQLLYWGIYFHRSILTANFLNLMPLLQSLLPWASIQFS